MTSLAWRTAATDRRSCSTSSDPMGESTCVACGECVQACPTGALMEATCSTRPDAAGIPGPRRSTRCVPIAASAARPTVHVKDDQILHIDGRNGPANEQRLCVKGRFGFDYISHPHRLTKPMIRKRRCTQGRRLRLDPANPWSISAKRAGTRRWSWRPAASERRATNRASALAGFGSAKGSNEEAYLFQKLVRAGFGTNNVDHCTRLCHASSVAALMEGIGSGAVTAPFTTVG